MKKILMFILMFIIVSNFTFAVYADDSIEFISDKDIKPRMHRYWTGKEFAVYASVFGGIDVSIGEYESDWYFSQDGFNFEASHLPKETHTGVLRWFNGYYVMFTRYSAWLSLSQVEWLSSKQSYYSVFDEKKNELKNISIPGYLMTDCVIIDDEFHYLTQRSDGGSKEYTYYKTKDFETMETVAVIKGKAEDAYEVFPARCKNIFEKPIKFETTVSQHNPNPYASDRTNVYTRDDKYSLDGIYFHNHPAINMSDSNTWYNDGYLYTATVVTGKGAGYYKMKVDWPEYTYVELNGTLLGFEQPPVTENDRTLVPMRFLFEQMGDTITWDEETMTATVSNGENTIVFGIDNVKATVNGEAEIMDVPARLINDKTYVPLRFLSENLGYTVHWNEEKHLATVFTAPTK
ncbi:MAG: hypothetical protein IJE10_05020 [Clostridia bacterium]|nr:hypothetical protein [Clostridia bacterium]